GIALGVSIRMSYAAQSGKVLPVGWVLLLANVFWSIAYDTEYAMVDREDDLRIGVKSSAILLGRRDVAGVIASQTIFLLMMTGIGIWQWLGPIYYASVIVAAALVYHQYKL